MIVQLTIFNCQLYILTNPKKLIYSKIISEETKNGLVPFSKEPVHLYL